MIDQKLPLTIFLLKPDRVAAFEKELLGGGQSQLPLSAPLDGYVLPLPSDQTEPRWLPAVNSVLPKLATFTVTGQSPAAILVMRKDGNTFLLTFGHAWAKLEDDWLELEFGRRIALNEIAPNKVVEISLEQVFAKWHVARERAPRASSVDEFGVQFDRDLVSSVEGLPKSSAILGKKLRGGTHLRIDVKFSTLLDVLDKSIRQFKSDAYKKYWPEIDNLHAISDEPLITNLEAQLDLDLKASQTRKKIVMFAPTYLREDIAATDSYVFGHMSKVPASTPYLLIEGWVSSLKKHKLEPSVSEAKTSLIHLLDEENKSRKKHSAFQCFGYETSLGGKQYVLSSGVWYAVSLDFIQKVNNEVGKIPAPQMALPAWNNTDKEPQYNAKCGQVAGYSFFDAAALRYGGGNSQLEFCDILHLASRTLFFVKIATRSSDMSHLLEQVRRTTELFFSSDEEYRVELLKLTKKLHKGMDTVWLQSRPRQGDWNICLVSLGRTASQLPFFARCGLAKLSRSLRNGGHQVFFQSP
jgi:uncharacterized protein (TIGR04141 family)